MEGVEPEDMQVVGREGDEKEEVVVEVAKLEGAKEECHGVGGQLVVAEGQQECRVSDCLAAVMVALREAKGLCDSGLNEATEDGPHPRELNVPLFPAPESAGHTLPYYLHDALWRLFKEGRWGWVEE